MKAGDHGKRAAAFFLWERKEGIPFPKVLHLATWNLIYIKTWPAAPSGGYTRGCDCSFTFFDQRLNLNFGPKKASRSLCFFSPCSDVSLFTWVDTLQRERERAGPNETFRRKTWWNSGEQGLGSESADSMPTFYIQYMDKKWTSWRGKFSCAGCVVRVTLGLVEERERELSCQDPICFFTQPLEAMTFYQITVKERAAWGPSHW